MVEEAHPGDSAIVLVAAVAHHRSSLVARRRYDPQYVLLYKIYRRQVVLNAKHSGDKEVLLWRRKGFAEDGR